MKKETEDWIRLLSRFFFGLYILLLIYMMFFCEEWGRSMFGGDYRYNLIPFQEIRRYLQYREQIGAIHVFLNLAGNVIGFIPFGALLPAVKKTKISFGKVALFSFELSLFIEVLQLMLRAGSCDVDDMILNTLGGCIGYGLHKGASVIRERRREKKI